jgi:hypothetical protein
MRVLGRYDGKEDVDASLVLTTPYLLLTVLYPLLMALCMLITCSEGMRRIWRMCSEGMRVYRGCAPYLLLRV